jgi:hypothetical protein
VQAVVEVDAEVDEAGLRVQQQVVGDGEDRVADGDQGALLAALDSVALAVRWSGR